MSLPFPTVERSFRRSDDREAVFDAIRERRRATLGEICDATGVRPSRVLGIIRGDPPEYSIELSLAVRGLVREGLDAHGEFFELTALGEQLEM